MNSSFTFQQLHFLLIDLHMCIDIFNHLCIPQSKEICSLLAKFLISNALSRILIIY